MKIDGMVRGKSCYYCGEMKSDMQFEKARGIYLCTIKCSALPKKKVKLKKRTFE